MKIIVPDYYKKFSCIADKCRHTCCKGWEVEIDEDSMERFKNHPDIMAEIDHSETAHFRLSDDEVCPFLEESGLCRMILNYGEGMLCQTCTDHPRFRNYWADRIEMGLGMVCEEAARLILSGDKPMELEVLSDDAGTVGKYDGGPNDSEATGTYAEEGNEYAASELPEDERWLMELRDRLIEEVTLSGTTGPIARLKEYLIFRHIPDALYDDRLEERIAFVEECCEGIEKAWKQSEGGFDELVEIVRNFSYDVEYDEDVKEKLLSSNN